MGLMGCLHFSIQESITKILEVLYNFMPGHNSFKSPLFELICMQCRKCICYVSLSFLRVQNVLHFVVDLVLENRKNYGGDKSRGDLNLGSFVI
jgi:hypothetical protein